MKQTVIQERRKTLYEKEPFQDPYGQSEFTIDMKGNVCAYNIEKDVLIKDITNINVNCSYFVKGHIDRLLFAKYKELPNLLFFMLRHCSHS